MWSYPPAVTLKLTSSPATLAREAWARAMRSVYRVRCDNGDQRYPQA
jgi:hypothetical protein